MSFFANFWKQKSKYLHGYFLSLKKSLFFSFFVKITPKQSLVFLFLCKDYFNTNDILNLLKDSSKVGSNKRMHFTYVIAHTMGILVPK